MTRPRFSLALLVAAALLLPGAGYSAGRTGTIAFLRHATHGGNAWVGDPSLFAIRADGSGLRRLTPAGVGVSTYQWSPDATRIAYLDMHSSLWVMRADGTDPSIYLVDFDGRDDHRLTRDSPRPVAWGALSWSPDGSALAYATNRTGDGDVYVIGADGRGRTRLTSSPDNDIAPEWAPR
jgi:TolB protein